MFIFAIPLYASARPIRNGDISGFTDFSNGSYHLGCVDIYKILLQKFSLYFVAGNHFGWDPDDAMPHFSLILPKPMRVVAEPYFVTDLLYSGYQ
jgi:hypothetical protein